MKKAIVLLVLTLYMCIMSFGQTVKNDAVKLEYIGYRTSPAPGYYVKVYNLQDCRANEQVQYKNNTTTLTINANSYALFNLGTQATDFKIMARSRTDCGCSDDSWITLKLTSAPLTFTNIHFERAKGEKYKGILYFTTADMVNVNKFTTRVSLNGTDFTEIGVVLPDNTQPNTTYMFPVDLKEQVIRLQKQ